MGLGGRSLWANLCDYTIRTARDITARQSCESVSRELSRPRYFNSFKLPRMAKTIQFETVQYEVSARKGRRNILGRPRVKGQSRISPVFSYPLSSNQKYTLNWTALRHATV